MNATQDGYRHDCGLDHVFLEGYTPTETEDGVTIDRINGLYRRLAERVVFRPGPLQGKEIRFLRTYLGLTPEELDDRIDFGAGLIQLAEHGNFTMTRESDIELRRLIYLHHGVPAPSIEVLYALYVSRNPDILVIRVRPDDSDVGWAHAA